MTDLRPTHSAPASGAHGTPAGVRALTAGELGHLDRARAHLRASGVDLTDAEAVGTLLHATRTRWADEPGAPLPQAMVMALGVGVGDLVVARVPGSRWALRTAGTAPTPAVVSPSGEDAALPLADVATRWRTGCTPTWVGEYVTAAAAHLTPLTAHEVPTPRVPARAALDVPTDDPTPLPSRAERRRPDAQADAPEPLPSRTTVAPTALLPARTPTATHATHATHAQADADVLAQADASLLAQPATALPSRSAARRPATDVAELPVVAALSSRATGSSAGAAGYFANAAGAFPTRHVVAPAPGAVSAGPTPPVHRSLASAFPASPVVAAPPVPPPAPAPYRAPADLPHPPSRGAQDIALGVLDQALDLALRPDGTARPFAVVDGSPTESHHPHAFDGEPARALQEARAWVRTTGAARAAVAWFGQLSGGAGAAVFVEASDAGAPSLVVAHRYSDVSYDEGRTRPPRPVGDPIVLGQGVPLL